MTSVAITLKDRLPTTIRTARLVLATPTLAHAPATAELANNAKVHKWLSRLPHPYGLSDAELFINEIARSETEFAWSILADETFVGTIGLHLDPEKAPELGYWLGEPYWGHGYATEAARAVVDAARAARVPELRSRAHSGNAGSRNVLRKAGFVETGTIVESAGNLAGQQMVLMRLEFSER